ncbi:M6 family metalloprotease domain-containing protein [Streptomyces sp. ME02-8801-2C]|uniref:M6 family metalloprotease domain-containing protein n=1 Tax=Streptomyces sp. ME02-8801-2C TaxID=3028680 RepID=UPI0029A3E164|nr:M6 family metalloprotease domain-containing protein [Streptomyces sp. ME02-8801-2C]MDX3454579.1 M6 family metalloprotease domain-containing protein [Streptomyces sp. ME02-8801-2C]
MPRQLPLKGLTRDALTGFKGLTCAGAYPRLRSTAAVLTTMTALAATSLIAGPSVAEPFSAQPCILQRTDAHHSEGLDTWNAAYPRPSRALDAVMIFLSFPDARPRNTPAALTADHFPATSDFFARASYGRFTLRPHPLRNWIRMPKPSTQYVIQRDWSAAHRAAYLGDALAAADRYVDFSRYDIVYFVADPDAPGVDSDATKVVNLDVPLHADGTDIRRVVTVFEKHPPDRLVLAHETGHVFDLPDLYHRPVDGKGDWDTYVGDWDLMGSQFGLAPDLFAWHKWKLGWLDPRQVVCVRGRGSTRLTLESLGAHPSATAQARADADTDADADLTNTNMNTNANTNADGDAVTGVGGARGAGAGAPIFGQGDGVKLAVVRTGADQVLAFEARGGTGNDRATCKQGVLVYRVRGGTQSGGGPVEVIDAHPRTEACWEDSVYPPLADAPVALGESFTVPGDDVRVEVQSRTHSGAWTVQITGAG